MSIVAAAYVAQTMNKQYGNVFYNGQISFNGTAAMAKWRLWGVIKQDRERVPAMICRRVDRGMFHFAYVVNLLAEARRLNSKRLLRLVERECKPRYALVRRS